MLAILSVLLSSCIFNSVPSRLQLRNEIAAHVFKVMKSPIEGNGGTGFEVMAPSGATFVMTNAHVCNILLADGTSKIAWVSNGLIAMPRRVVAISDEKDLCLLEGISGGMGLKVSKDAPQVGEWLHVVGHPKLGPLIMSSGEFYEVCTINVAGPRMSTPSVKRGSYCTTAVADVGSSGSPAVNEYGEVIGVLFAVDGKSRAALVSLTDVKDFLLQR